MTAPSTSSAPDLAAVFADLVRGHIATPAQPLPEPRPGITWIWAANGLFKLGVDPHRRVLLRVSAAPAPPGLPLANLMPGIWRPRWPRRLPGRLLPAILAHARNVCKQSGGQVEQQYFVTERAGVLHARLPHQDASASRIHYTVLDAEPVILDIHSHHQLPAYFSATDDRDDTGLGVSAVIGRIFERPELVVRLCCYGHTQRVPALTIFDSLGPFGEPAVSREERSCKH